MLSAFVTAVVCGYISSTLTHSHVWNALSGVTIAVIGVGLGTALSIILTPDHLPISLTFIRESVSAFVMVSLVTPLASLLFTHRGRTNGMK